jgi:stearoyl-CoA desaturase (delta-9 desaturase)
VRPTEADERLVPAQAKITVLATVVLPFLGLIGGMVLLWEHGFNRVQLGIFVLMYFLSGMGITIGYHRLFAHRAFETIRPIRLLLAIAGSMAVQGPLLKWVATHRLHHRHSDQEGDPHSPHLHGRSIAGVLKGFLHAHMGWLFATDPPGLTHYVGDLLSDRLLRATSRMFPLWVLAGLAIPTVLGGLLTWSWMGALMGLVWGGFARIFLVHHVTFSINSVCHIWGRRPFRSHDRSCNNALFGVMGFGEGWHNNHHAFPTSARHGLMWWQFDVTWLTIRALERLRLAWRVRLPDPERMATKLAARPEPLA